jgi:Uma2 family endonuclease
MATVIETTRTTKFPPPNSAPKTNGKRRVRSEESINRFLIKNKGYEYINGKLEKKEMPTAKHSGIATRCVIKIGIYLEQNNIGRVYGDNTLFKIGANRRIPDAAFISAEKIPSTGEPFSIWDFAPDIAIEVISPSERHNAVEQKIRDYFAAGVRQVWKIVPESKTVSIYFSPSEISVLTENETLTCEEILPNFRLNLSDIFID